MMFWLVRKDREKKRGTDRVRKSEGKRRKEKKREREREKRNEVKLKVLTSTFHGYSSDQKSDNDAFHSEKCWLARDCRQLLILNTGFNFYGIGVSHTLREMKFFGQILLHFSLD